MKRSRDICVICADTTLTTSRECICPFCDFKCCIGCTKQYILSVPSDPSCMNCHQAWPFNILTSLVPMTWLRNEYKRHRESVLFDRELSMMPSTQPYVLQELQRRDNAKLLAQITQQRNELRAQLRRLDLTYLEIQRQGLREIPVERRQFNHKCSRPECRGFLSTSWRCSVCDTTTCSDCGALKEDENHECVQSDIQSFTMIKKECRRCPSCAEYIYKIDGCDQMWCTSCKTGFSWRTGRIERASHNPHYVQYLQQQRGGTQARDPADIPCGGRPTYQEILQGFGQFRGRDSRPASPELTELTQFQRIVHHIDGVTRPTYPVQIGDDRNRHLRVAYSLNEISRDEFMRQLQVNERNDTKRRDIGLVLTMVVNVIDDLLRQALISKDLIGTLEQLHSISGYMNSEMEKISKTFSNCVVPVILRIGQNPCRIDISTRSAPFRNEFRLMTRQSAQN